MSLGSEVFNNRRPPLHGISTARRPEVADFNGERKNLAIWHQHRWIKHKAPGIVSRSTRNIDQGTMTPSDVRHQPPSTERVILKKLYRICEGLVRALTGTGTAPAGPPWEVGQGGSGG